MWLGFGGSRVSNIGHLCDVTTDGQRFVCNVLPEESASTVTVRLNWFEELKQRLVKTGGRPVKHARYYWLLLAAFLCQY